jgi:photosystem II stability/assembly factor-like uncharacterized protein
MPLPRALRFVAIFLLAGILSACSARHQIQSSRFRGARGGWQPVSLPFRPIDVTSAANTLWVCGVDEMIAKSEDGGQTWQLKHENADGEVLLHITFVGEKIGYAAGTSGLLLWTKDDGETWTSGKAGSETILDISFADDMHGIRHTRSAVEMTSDGGATWTPISALKSNEELAKFKIIWAVAALDANRSAILLKEAPYSDQIFFVTGDGGKNWRTVYIPSVGLRSLVIHHGEYWAFGHEVIEKDQPGGAYGVPLALHSTDGVNWQHGMRSSNEYSDCNAQGCILWDAAIVDLYHEKPLFWALPADGSLTPKWAAARGTVCSVGSVLKCAGAKPSGAPPRRPEMSRPITIAINSQAPLPGCLICRLDSFPISKKLLGRGILYVNFIVCKDGTVGDVRVMRAPKEIETAVVNAVGAWVFQPPRQNGIPVEIKRNLELSMMCFAFPSNEEGTCTLQIVQVPAGSQI